jgi:hypothetical protein
MLLTNEPIKQGVIQLAVSGVKIRTITEITEDNVSYVKELIKKVGDSGTFRHLDNVTGNSSISDGKIYQSQIMGDLSHPSTITNSANNVQSVSFNQNIQDKNALTSPSPAINELVYTRVPNTAEPQSIMSTIKAFVDQQQYIFEMMWDKAIPARQRIKEIEQGFKREFIDTVRDPIDILNLIFNVLKSTTDEIQMLFSSFNAFQRLEHLGVMKNIKELALEYGIKVRILVIWKKKTKVQE